MRRLLMLLDEELRLLEQLVACLRQERQHVLALEPDLLPPVLERKRDLLDQGQRLRLERKRDLLDQGQRLRLERERLVAGALAGGAKDGGLAELVDALPEPAAGPLRARRARLVALLATVGRLNAATRAHVERQLRWVRASRRTLLGIGAGSGYGPDGRGDGQRPRGVTLRGSA